MRKILFLFSLFLSVSTAEAAYLDLAWDPNTERDLAGYYVYYGTQSGIYSHSVDVGNTTSYRLDNLADGVRYYIALTAYDGAGNESNTSGEVSGIGVTNDPPPPDDPDSDSDGLPDDWEIPPVTDSITLMTVSHIILLSQRMTEPATRAKLLVRFQVLA